MSWGRYFETLQITCLSQNIHPLILESILYLTCGHWYCGVYRIVIFPCLPSPLHVLIRILLLERAIPYTSFIYLFIYICRDSGIFILSYGLKSNTIIINLSSFLHICRHSWIFILSYRLKSNTIILYFLAQIVPVSTIRAPAGWPLSSFHKASSLFEHFLVPQNVPGSSDNIPPPALEPIPSPRCLGFLHWKIRFETTI